VNRRTFLLWLGAIVLGGAAVRVLYTLQFAPYPPHGLFDQVYYRLEAQLVANGHGFTDPFLLAFQGRHVASIGHPPFYTVFLAGVYKLFGAGYALPLAGTVSGAVTIVALAFVARHLAGDRAGLIAAALAAVYPMLITADGALMSESLYGALLAVTLLVSYRLVERPSLWPAIAFGVLMGLATLTHGDAFLFLPMVLVPAFRAPGGRWRSVLVALAAFVVVMAPWTIRNAEVFGEFIPISSNTVIAGANCHDTYYGSNIGGWDLGCIKAYPGNEASSIDRATQDAVTYAEHHVTRLPVVAAAREVRTWFALPGNVSNLEGRAGHAVDLGYLMYFALVALSVYGIVVLRRRGVGVWLIVSPFVLVALIALVFYGGVRFRQPAELSLVVLGAIALDALWQRVAQRHAPLDLAAQAGD
jgi:4-amino-4-deoxy-L-arabinose transferase-like glycosyltransferase